MGQARASLRRKDEAHTHAGAMGQVAADAQGTKGRTARFDREARQHRAKIAASLCGLELEYYRETRGVSLRDTSHFIVIPSYEGILRPKQVALGRSNLVMDSDSI